MADFHSFLNRLIADLVNLIWVSYQTCERTGSRFVTITESNATTRYRWDEEHGFVFCGEMV